VVELGVPILLDCPVAAPPGLEDFASALFFGQVTRRFPQLRVALLDGGSGWRAAVCAAMAISLESGDRRLESFYFGLDSTELGAAAASNDNRGPLCARINALCAPRARWESSHEVADGSRLVEEGILGEGDLRAYLYDTPYRFHSDASPTFFEGTAVDEKRANPAPQPAVALAR
jgi:hypothetical protein